MMSEDLAGQSISMAQKSAEIAVEIARLLRRMYDSHAQRKRERAANQPAKVKAKKEIDVGNGEIRLSELKKSGGVLMQPNISARDMETITAKAKDYDIPVSFIGKGENAENVTLAFKTDDKAVVDQILNEVMTEKLATKPDDYLMFEMKNLGAVQTMETMLKDNNIPADIAISADGKYQIVYEAKNAEAMKAVKNELKNMHDDIAENFIIERRAEGGFKFTDKSVKSAGKHYMSLKKLPTKDQLIRLLLTFQERFGYSESKAVEAANKFESTLSGKELEYFRTNTRQNSLLNNFDRNIRMKNESILVKPYTFTRANFVSDNVNRYFVSSDEKAIALIPDKMSREEMADTVRYKLGVTDPETVKAIVDKTEKVEAEYKKAELKKEAREAEAVKQKGDFAIERHSEKFFEVSQGMEQRIYDLSTKKQSIKALQNDFGISLEEAERIFQKAQNQSPLQNEAAEQKGDFAIERHSEKFFEVSQGTEQRIYDLSAKDQSIKALQNDFGISSKKAERIFQKAQNQSPLQNDFHKMAEKSKANAKTKPIKEKKTSKGAIT